MTNHSPQTIISFGVVLRRDNEKVRRTQYINFRCSACGNDVSGGISHTKAEKLRATFAQRGSVFYLACSDSCLAALEKGLAHLPVEPDSDHTVTVISLISPGAPLSLFPDFVRQIEEHRVRLLALKTEIREQERIALEIDRAKIELRTLENQLRKARDLIAAIKQVPDE